MAPDYREEGTMQERGCSPERLFRNFGDDPHEGYSLTMSINPLSYYAGGFCAR